MAPNISTRAQTTTVEPFEFRSVEVLRGVGPAVATKLEKLGIYRVQDLLFHLPLRYEDRTRVVPLGSLQHGQHAVIEGVIEHAEVRYGGKRRGGASGRSLLCHVADGTGSVLLRFFYFNATQQANLVKGVRLRCYGEARFNNHRLEMVHPEYRTWLTRYCINSMVTCCTSMSRTRYWRSTAFPVCSRHSRYCTTLHLTRRCSSLNNASILHNSA